MILGTVASAGLAIVGATRIFAAEVAGFFQLGAMASSGYSVAWSLALFGAGHLVGLSVGMAMLTGLVIAWAISVPILTALQPVPEGVTMAAHTLAVWRTQVRFDLGAGVIGVSAIWTLATLAKPVVGGLVATLASSKAHATGDDRDRDLPAGRIVAFDHGVPGRRGLAGVCLRRADRAGRPFAAVACSSPCRSCSSSASSLPESPGTWPV